MSDEYKEARSSRPVSTFEWHPEDVEMLTPEEADTSSTSTSAWQVQRGASSAPELIPDVDEAGE